MSRVYLDFNATAPLVPAAIQAMEQQLNAAPGNASSLHREGRRARKALEHARRAVAEMLGAHSDEVVFTSGGTEADHAGLRGLARLGRSLGRPARVLLSAIEHPAILGAADQLAKNGFEIVWLPVDSAGTIDIGAFRRVCASGAAVASLQLANHETGVVQNLGALATVAHEAEILVFCDAVQAAGKMHIDVSCLGADAIAVSAHKLGGPMGVGALWVARRHQQIPALIKGGHQERGHRPGTENLVGIAGFGAAASVAAQRIAMSRNWRSLRGELEAGAMAITGALVLGRDAERVGNTVSVSFEGASGDVIVTALDLVGIAASTGAACASARREPSPGLLAMGLTPAQALATVRFSLGPETGEEDVKQTLEVLSDIIARARQFS